MWYFLDTVAVYQNRNGELALMSGDHNKQPVTWDFGMVYTDNEWSFVCLL